MGKCPENDIQKIVPQTRINTGFFDLRGQKPRFLSKKKFFKSKILYKSFEEIFVISGHNDIQKFKANFIDI